MSTLRASLVLAMVSVGCGDGSSAAPDPDCNPLGGGACLLPWPSSVYLTEDSSTVTGYRVALPKAAMPTNIDGVQIDPSHLNHHDGFSPNAVMVVGFEGGVSPDGLPPLDDVAASLEADAPVVLLDLETGERVPILVEVDLNFTDPADRALLIRPLVRLQPARRYAVAVRKAVKNAAGEELARSPAFQALVDGENFNHPRFKALAARYPAIFDGLEAAGVPREDLVLAWDLVTASDEMLTADLRSMRDQTLDAIDEDGGNLTFQAEEVPDVGTPDKVLRAVLGTHQGPDFMTDGAEDESVLVRDADGLPMLGGMGDWPFAALIPACVANPANRPAPVVVFGHGLFGSGEGALHEGWGLLQEVANDYCAVLIAGNWMGLTERDVPSAIYTVNNLNDQRRLVEKLPQGVINFLSLVRVARGPLGSSPLFQVDGESVIDPTRIHYFGVSLGGIMGNVFMAYEPDVEVGILAVPGGNWSLLFERSFAWPSLRETMVQAYRTRFDYATNLGLLAMFWDRYDPITTAPYVTTAPKTGVPPKKIFLYEALADSLVTNHSTEMLVRTMGVPVTTPSVRLPHGIAETSAAVTSGLTIYDEHPDPVPPVGNVAPIRDNGTHGGVHNRPAIRRQILRILSEGQIHHECALEGSPAPCDCATGACN